MPPPGIARGDIPGGRAKKGTPVPGLAGNGGLIEERGYGADYFPALMAAWAAARRAMGTRKGEQDT